MRIGPLELSWGRKSNGDVLSIEQVMKRFEALYETASGISVSPENCEESPTVKAIVTAVTNRIASSPVHVLKKTERDGLTYKEPQPNHHAAQLLGKPNDWQTVTSYWMDAASWLLRYGNYYAFKSRGVTGPIRRLLPLHPCNTNVKQRDDLSVVYETTLNGGARREFDPAQVHHVRLRARDGVKGDSPINDVRESIALEMAAEKFGATFFGNGALPGITFEYEQGSSGFKNDTERQAFIEDFQEKFNKRGRFRAIMPPRGIKVGHTIPVENDKAQFLQLRELQRTIIAGAFGVPPHLVGDLSKGTFNNVEQQAIEFKTNVVLPLVRIFESAMERDLLNASDRANGIIIRFNLDGDLRGDFKSRQEGLAIMRQNGAINADEWREMENMNPRTDGGGQSYFDTGPSGQTAGGATPARNSEGSAK